MDKVGKTQQCIGIVAEYNPFHNGHAHHIRRAREALRAEDAPVVVVLSSSFAQRGEALCADKWTRTEMALAGGADLVLELPFAYACNAAPEFARGAVDTLAATRLVTHLAFGMESPDFELDAALSILIQEPLSFKAHLRKNLKKGLSYPKAMATALDTFVPGSGAFLSAPNNTLALAYLLHSARSGYALTPLRVQRTGAAYHDATGGPLASATAIRKALASDAEWLEQAMPPYSLKLLRRERERGRLYLDSGTLWLVLRSLLARSHPEELRRYAGMDEGLENLFLRHYTRASSYEDFIGRCVCARYTRSRLQRQTLRLLVGLDRWTTLALSRSSPPYIRVLGCSQTGRRLLRERADSAPVRVITRLAAAEGGVEKTSAQLEFQASKLRELLLPCPDLRREETQKVLCAE